MDNQEILVRLEDISEQAENIISVTQSISFKKFICDVVCSAAVIRFFEIIGKAAKYIPDSFREEHPEIK